MEYLLYDYHYKVLATKSDNFIPKFLNASDQIRRHYEETLLKVLIHKEVRQRPGRCEPRVRKRRFKAYPLMQKSIHQYHIDLKSA
jgi:hypothetical protein